MMLQPKEITTIDIQSEVELVHRPFRVEENSKILTLLIKNLYSDPIKAVVREIFANARDACRERERLEGLPENSLMTYIRPPSEEFLFLAIKDQGIGINRQRYEEVYCNLGASTKEKTKDVGGWGIGGKCPTAYTQSFLIETTYKHEGGWERSVINVYLGGTDLLYRGPATVQESGTVVKVPIAEKDVRRFNEAIKEYTNAIKNPIFKIVGEDDKERPQIIKVLHPKGFVHPVEIAISPAGEKLIYAIDEVPYTNCSRRYSGETELKWILDIPQTSGLYVYIVSEDIGVGVPRESIVEDEEKFESLAEAIHEWRLELISNKLKTIANDEDQDPYALYYKIRSFLDYTSVSAPTFDSIKMCIEAARNGIPSKHSTSRRRKDVPKGIQAKLGVANFSKLSQTLLNHRYGHLKKLKDITQTSGFPHLKNALSRASDKQWLIFEGNYLEEDKDLEWSEAETEAYVSRIAERWIKYGNLETALRQLNAELSTESSDDEDEENEDPDSPSKPKKERVHRPTVKEDLWRKAWGPEPVLDSTKHRRVLLLAGPLGELCPKQREYFGDNAYNIRELQHLTSNTVKVPKRYIDDISAWLERKGWNLGWIKDCVLPSEIAKLQIQIGGVRTLFYGTVKTQGAASSLKEILSGDGDPLTEDIVEGLSLVYSSSDVATIKTVYQHNILMREFLNTWSFPYHTTVTSGYIYGGRFNSDKIKTTEDIKAALLSIKEIDRLQKALNARWGISF